MSARPYNPIRRALRYILPALGLLLAVFCWRLSVQAAVALRTQEELVGYHAQPGMDAAAFAAMQEVEQRALPPRPFALWDEQAGSIQDALTQRMQDVRVLRVRGDTRLVLPAPETLAEDDLEGCILDEATALALFGTRNVVGVTVLLGGKAYTVRGVMQGPAGTVLIRPAREDALTNVCMQGRAAAEEFAVRHALRQAPVQAVFYAEIAHVLTQLPGLLCLLLAVGLLGRAMRAAAAYPLRYGLALVARCCVATLCVLYVLRMLPAAYLPARWSDFGHYTRTLEEIGRTLETYFMMEKQLPDRLRSMMLLRSMLGLVAAALGLLAYRAYTRGRLKEQLEEQTARAARYGRRLRALQRQDLGETKPRPFPLEKGA